MVKLGDIVWLPPVVRTVKELVLANCAKDDLVAIAALVLASAA